MYAVRFLVVCCALLTTALPGQAASNCRPIAASRVAEMWDAYSGQSGAEAIPTSAGFDCVAIDSSHRVVCRTETSHPAHPSIVIRTAIESDGKLFVRTEADTAADCDAFLKLMQQYDELTRATVGGQ